MASSTTFLSISASSTHFSPSLCSSSSTSLSKQPNPNSSPSMGAVTLIALGNGAPDVFASVAAVGGGQARTGFRAILSAGTFVSALVAIYAAPFSVSPGPFMRDVLFYLIAAFFLFCVP